MPEQKKPAAAKKNAKPARKTVSVKPAADEKPVAKTNPTPKEELKDEAAVIDKIRNDDMVTFRIPEDPLGEVKVWARTIQGHAIVLRAGETRTLPRFIVDFIEQSVALEREAEVAVSEFMTRNGKRLNY